MGGFSIRGFTALSGHTISRAQLDFKKNNLCSPVRIDDPGSKMTESKTATIELMSLCRANFWPEWMGPGILLFGVTWRAKSGNRMGGRAVTVSR
jgi:hypothetical protein